MSKPGKPISNKGGTKAKEVTVGILSKAVILSFLSRSFDINTLESRIVPGWRF